MVKNWTSSSKKLPLAFGLGQHFQFKTSVKVFLLYRETDLPVDNLTYVNNSLYVARKYAPITVRRRYLFREEKSFLRAQLEENCERVGNVAYLICCILSPANYSPPRKSLVKGERFIRVEGKPELFLILDTRCFVVQDATKRVER